MKSVLQCLIGQICLAYLDDVIIIPMRCANHVNDLKAVLDCLCYAGLKLKPEICNFFCKQVLYFENVILAASVSFDFAKFRVLANWLLPTIVRQQQSFLGFVNFYGDFIDKQTAISA